MKTITKINLFFCAIGIIALMLFGSCSATSSISMEVLQPAQINLPSHIKKVAVLNRSLPAKGEGFMNFLEGFFTGEVIRGDREGSDKCINGVVNKLNASPRLGAILVGAHTFKGTGTREFPNPLDWNEVDKVCKLYNTDAIVILETFDSDIYFNQGKSSHVEKKNNKDTVIIDYKANLKLNVNSGWRIYDNFNKKIVDENSFTDNKGWDVTGRTPGDALSKLPNKRDAVNTSGYFSGEQMAIRISPNWTRVYRNYYKKGHDDFKITKKMVRANNWDAAVIIWQKLVQNPDKEVAGRAAYNMALASEFKGNLPLALEWANKSLKTYGNRKASGYINTINRRIQDQEKLNDQMK